MAEFLTSYAGVIAIIAVLVAAALGALLADALDRADRWQAWAEDLEAENDRLRANARPRVVALPPRQTGEHRG